MTGPHAVNDAFLALGVGNDAFLAWAGGHG
jgi:hypothetical protein